MCVVGCGVRVGGGGWKVNRGLGGEGEGGEGRGRGGEGEGRDVGGRCWERCE